ncbi:hypothetical protein GCM10025870_04630 [Agromyces marinus]|uniref:Uncharacterized protein n=1 Tax=Agromyces marinus TaxID=1389020 RepID=A0ABM8GY23_9MICO|nr:hypothetical protein [Agromyces marinus]BDZ53390.1 hypothetical protein GCM10025870_04630 [Agromyces marinus]
MRDGGSQKDAAARLGISDAAVSQRLKTALWAAEADAHPTLVRLVADLGSRFDAGGSAGSDTGHPAEPDDGGAR